VNTLLKNLQRAGVSRDTVSLNSVLNERYNITRKQVPSKSTNVHAAYAIAKTRLRLEFQEIENDIASRILAPTNTPAQKASWTRFIRQPLTKNFWKKMPGRVAEAHRYYTLAKFCIKIARICAVFLAFTGVIDMETAVSINKRLDTIEAIVDKVIPQKLRVWYGGYLLAKNGYQKAGQNKGPTTATGIGLEILKNTLVTRRKEALGDPEALFLRHQVENRAGNAIGALNNMMLPKTTASSGWFGTVLGSVTGKMKGAAEALVRVIQPSVAIQTRLDHLASLDDAGVLNALKSDSKLHAVYGKNANPEDKNALYVFYFSRLVDAAARKVTATAKTNINVMEKNAAQKAIESYKGLLNGLNISQNAS
jgi:hypothetical protein